MSKAEITSLKLALENEIQARMQSEKILEETSKEFYDIQYHLKEENKWLKRLLQEKTSEAEGQSFNIPDSYLGIDLKALSEQKIKLKDSQSRIATVISNLKFGVLLEDEHRSIALTNQVFCDMFGITATPDQMVGLNCSNAAEQSKIFFKDPDSFVKKIEKLLRDKKTVIAEELNTLSGKVFQRDFIPIYSGGLYKGILWVYTDITLTKQYKDALQSQKEKYSSIIANMNLGLVEVDNIDRVQLVNKSFCALSGYSENELIGKKLAKLLKISDPNMMSIHHKKRLNGISDTYEVSVTIKNGSVKYWVISGAPRYNEKGEVVGSIRIHLDITAQHELAVQKEYLLHELETSNISLNEYAHIVSHDLKSPLRSISTLVSWLAEDHGEKLGVSGLEQLDLIQSKISSMDQLIIGILKYSSIGIEKQNISFIDLTALILEIQNTLYWPQHIELKFLNKMPVIRADKIQMQQLFQNLMGNAIEYIDKPKGLISIGLEDLGSFWQFSVSDNGLGIKKDYYHKIFEIFQSVGNNSNASGIGLSIVKKIVQIYNGKVWLESEIGEGTTFYFTIKKTIS
jgi:PAS domain S-box-containing protein